MLTRRLHGPQPAALERRYVGVRSELANVARAAYVSDARWRFLEARFAVAPTILDPGFVARDLKARTITGFKIEEMVETAANQRGLIVLCDFKSRGGLDRFLAELGTEAHRRGVELRVRFADAGLALLAVGG